MLWVFLSDTDTVLLLVRAFTYILTGILLWILSYSVRFRDIRWIVRGFGCFFLTLSIAGLSSLGGTSIPRLILNYGITFWSMVNAIVLVHYFIWRK